MTFRVQRILTVSILLFALTSQSCTKTGSSSGNWDATDTLPTDPKVLMGELDNGLRYYIRENSKPENRADLRLVINVGSVQESSNQCGVAHLTEHLIFKGTKSYSEEDLQNFFELSGMKFGPHINATVTFDETVFKLHPKTDSPEMLDESFKIMSEWAQSASFDSADIAEERHLLFEEPYACMSRYSKTISKYMPAVLAGSRYASHLPVGHQVHGKEGCMDSLQAFYKKWYRPELMAVVAVGDFDVSDVKTRIKTHFSSLQNISKPTPRHDYEVPEQDSVIVNITRDKELSFAQVLMYYKKDPGRLQTVADFQRNLIEKMVQKMMKQRYNELLQAKSPAVMFAGSHFTDLCRSKEAFVHYGIVDNKAVLSGFDALATEIERVKQHGFTSTELERTKSEILSDYLNESKEGDKIASSSWASGYTDYYLKDIAVSGPEVEYKLAREELPGIDLSEVNDYFKSLTSDKNLAIIITAPEDESVVVPSGNELMASLNGLSQKKLDPYVDSFESTELSLGKLNPGKIVEEKTIGDLNLTEWTLSNGATVVVKPTNFKNDEILFSAFSPGGTSLYDLEEYRSIMFLSHFIGMSGVGEMTQAELQKFISDKKLAIYPMIENSYEGMRGKASPNDLETLLKLNYLYFTQPRKDEVAFQSFKEMQKMIYSNLDNNTDFYFMKNLYQTLFGNHPRVQVPTTEQIDSFNLDRMINIYRERYEDAGDFTFVFVGNINFDHLRPLVEEYIGGLPAVGEQEEARDNDLYFEKKATSKTIYSSKDEKGMASLAFTGKIDWSWKETLKIQALKEMLDLVLREELNESNPGFYSLEIKNDIHENPQQEYMIYVRFGSDPEDVTKNIGKIKSAIRRLKSKGPSELTVKKVQQAMLRDFETNMEENKYWLKKLVLFYKQDEDPTRMLDYKQVIEEMDQEFLKQATNDYLQSDQMIEMVMLPKPQ